MYVVQTSSERPTCATGIDQGAAGFVNAIQPKGQPNKTYKVTNQTTSAEIVVGKYPHDGYCPAWGKECKAKPLGRQCGSKQKPPVQSCDTKPKVNHKHHKTSKKVFSICSSTQGDKQDSSSSGDEYVFITTGTDKKKTPKSHIKDWDISDSGFRRHSEQHQWLWPKLAIATTALVPPDTKVFSYGCSTCYN